MGSFCPIVHHSSDEWYDSSGVSIIIILCTLITFYSSMCHLMTIHNHNSNSSRFVRYHSHWFSNGLFVAYKKTITDISPKTIWSSTWYVQKRLITTDLTSPLSYKQCCSPVLVVVYFSSSSSIYRCFLSHWLSSSSTLSTSSLFLFVRRCLLANDSTVEYPPT